MARERRAGREAVEGGSPTKAGETSAGGAGAERRVAIRVCTEGESRRRRERSDRAMAAIGPGLAACTRKRSAQRAIASEGDRDRHPKGEDRASGLRGAGRGEAAPGGIEPGARSPGPGGRPYHPGPTKRYPTVIGQDRVKERTGTQAPPDR